MNRRYAVLAAVAGLCLGVTLLVLQGGLTPAPLPPSTASGTGLQQGQQGQQPQQGQRAEQSQRPEQQDQQADASDRAAVQSGTVSTAPSTPEEPATRQQHAREAARQPWKVARTPATEGPCAGQREVRGADGLLLRCMHGHAARPGSPQPGTAQAPVQAAPAQGVDINVARVSWPCVGTGADGPRVQLVYAHREGRANRLAQHRAAFADIARRINGAFYRSGYPRPVQVRFATDSSCGLDVRAVAVKGDAASWQNVVDQLHARGMRSVDRKYLVLSDVAPSYACGEADLTPDDRAGPANLNNAGPNYAVVYGSQCWGGDTPAHELVHTLGGVQASSPHATPGGHCRDQYDVMCYDDASDYRPQVTRCPGWESQSYLDCRRDDYFSTAVRPSGYLARHWNVANNRFLLPTAATRMGGAPAVASQAPRSLDLFVRGTDNALWHRPMRSGSWGTWTKLGGTLTSAPTAVSRKAGWLDVYARGADGSLQQLTYRSNRWGSWRSLGGRLTSAPAATVDSRGRVHVFGRGPAGQLQQTLFSGGSWSAWRDLGGRLTSSPSAVWLPRAGAVRVSARGTDNTVHFRLGTSQRWQPWLRTSNSFTLSAPADVVPQGSRQDQIFLVGPDQNAVEAMSPGSGYPRRYALGGGATSAPAAGSSATGRTDVFVRGADGKVRHRHRVGSSWSSWVDLGGTMSAAPDL